MIHYKIIFELKLLYTSSYIFFRAKYESKVPIEKPTTSRI